MMHSPPTADLAHYTRSDMHIMGGLRLASSASICPLAPDELTNVATSPLDETGSCPETVVSVPTAPTTCRICCGTDGRLCGDPLITPCKCTGSVAHIHKNCLKKWIEIRSKSSFVNQRNLADICEICLSPFTVSFPRLASASHQPVHSLEAVLRTEDPDESRDSVVAWLDWFNRYNIIIFMRVALALVAASLIPLLLIACPNVQTMFTVCYKKSELFIILWTTTAAFFILGFIFHVLIHLLVRGHSASEALG